MNSDQVSEAVLAGLQAREQVRANRVPGVRTALVVLSATGLVFDHEALRQKILLSYPEAAIFFVTTVGKPLGIAAPLHVDLVIDLTGPGQRQPFFLASRLRRMSRVVIGRKAGWYRRNFYDKVFDEKAVAKSLPQEMIQRERAIQLGVLALAGVALAQTGEIAPDRGDTIALELPPLLQV